MLMLVRCAALAACLVVAPPRPQDASVDAQTGLCVLQFDEQDGEQLADVLSLFQKLLNTPIDWLPAEVSADVVHVTGPQSVETGKLRDFLDSLLDRHGFWVWDDESGGHKQIVVRDRSHTQGRAGTKYPFTARLVTLDELQAGPEPRLPIYTVSFEVRHLHVRDLLSVFISVLDPTMEVVRIVEGSNQLLVTATRDHLLQTRDMLASIDKPPAGQPAVEGRSAFDQRLAAIEARLTALESAAAR